ncbi:unnamed protein product, partial [Rotaria sp. Silwood2]
TTGDRRARSLTRYMPRPSACEPVHRAILPTYSMTLTMFSMHRPDATKFQSLALHLELPNIPN